MAQPVRAVVVALAALYLCTPVAQVAAQEAGYTADVHFRLSFPRRANQYVHVEMRVPSVGESLELAMPTWTPGSYDIRDFSGKVEQFTARSVGGQELAVEKVAKNRWSVSTAGARNIVVDYDVWAGVLAVQDSWVETEFAVLNGAGIFIYSDNSREATHWLEVALPAEWPEAHIALPGPDGQGRYRARNFDELVDSPLLAGKARRTSFEAGGARFALVDYGATGQWDYTQAVRDLIQLADTHIEMWGVNPFEREYLFLNVLMGGRGGLEHDHSTLMMASPTVMRSRDDYVKWLGLASHELFHAWNVRRLRPRALAEYNYEEEVYTRQLWIAEGLTSYYDNLLLSRAAIVSAQEYLDLLAAEIQQYEVQPGRLVTSAEESSYDSWIRQYRPNANQVNSNTNYYRKGAVIGFVIDTAIRQASRNRTSLDDALREMYARYGPGGAIMGGYPEGALAQIVGELVGGEVAARLEALRTSASDPDVDSALDWYGLQLLRTPDRDALVDAGKPAPVDFGVTWLEDVPGLRVEHVLHGSPAALAGILPNDELIAVDGLRVTRGDHEVLIKTFVPGERVTLTLARHGRLLNLDVEIQEAVSARYVISAQERVPGSKERRLEAWLGRQLRINP